MSVWRGVSAALAAGLALVVCLRPTREVGTVVQVTPSPQLMQVQVNSAEQANALQLVRVQVSSAEQASAPRLTPGSYLSIRDQVLTGGLDMLHPAGASGPRTPMPQVIDVQPYDFHLPSVFGGNS